LFGASGARSRASLRAVRTDRVVVCSHSGCLRAIAAEAVGRDLGEPAHLEAVRVRLTGARPGAPARLSYRGETVELAVPTLQEPAWP
jgi:broad specificity phosphatase PhoE